MGALYIERGRRLWSAAAYLLFTMCVLAAVLAFIFVPSLSPAWLLQPTSSGWMNVGMRLLLQVVAFFASLVVLISGWKWLFSRLLSRDEFQQIARQLRTDWSEDGA
jgi:hypothetical protein